MKSPENRVPQEQEQKELANDDLTPQGTYRYFGIPALILMTSSIYWPGFELTLNLHGQPTLYDYHFMDDGYHFPIAVVLLLIIFRGLALHPTIRGLLGFGWPLMIFVTATPVVVWGGLLVNKAMLAIFFLEREHTSVLTLLFGRRSSDYTHIRWVLEQHPTIADQLGNLLHVTVMWHCLSVVGIVACWVAFWLLREDALIARSNTETEQ